MDDEAAMRAIDLMIEAVELRRQAEQSGDLVLLIRSARMLRQGVQQLSEASQPAGGMHLSEVASYDLECAGISNLPAGQDVMLESTAKGRSQAAQDAGDPLISALKKLLCALTWIRRDSRRST